VLSHDPAVRPGMSRTTVLWLYTTYSYLLNLTLGVLELVPYPLRILGCRLLLGRLGRATLIDYGTYFRYPRKIRIGDHVAINRGCELYAIQQAAGGTITIGNGVALGPHVRIFAGGHDYGTRNLAVTAQSVVIHDFVWVGGSTTILPGVVIGEGAIIGAGSVVSEAIPPYTIAVGNPARVIKQRQLADGAPDPPGPAS
jgi:acetyltransferase-like isoleucine patch superfamily enzyme